MVLLAYIGRGIEPFPPLPFGKSRKIQKNGSQQSFMLIERSFGIVERFLTSKLNPILEFQFRFLMNYLLMSKPLIYQEITKFSCLKRDKEQITLKIENGLHQFVKNV